MRSSSKESSSEQNSNFLSKFTISYLVYRFINLSQSNSNFITETKLITGQKYIFIVFYFTLETIVPQLQLHFLYFLLYFIFTNLIITKQLSKLRIWIAFMSSKIIINPKSLTQLKIPWNITEDQLDSAILGSLLFSISACLYFFVFGKLIGRTSLIQLVDILKKKNDLSIWLTVLAGVVFCSALVKQLHHEHYINFYPYDSKAYVRKTDEGLLAVAGFLVGVGISLAGGCTFGHGITGLARGQKASFLSVLLFFTAAHLTNRYNLIENIPEQLTDMIKLKLPKNISSDYYIYGCLIVPFFFFIVFKDKSVKGMIKYMLNFVIGIFFCLGMMIGGITKIENVLDAFNINNKYWNPSMPIFYGITIVICTIFLNFMIQKKIVPVFSSSMQNPEEKVSFPLVIGSIIFGVGWGLGGLCPGPVYANIPQTDMKIIVYWGVFYVFGFKLTQLVCSIVSRIFGGASSKA